MPTLCPPAEAGIHPALDSHDDIDLRAAPDYDSKRSGQIEWIHPN
jgi:hypothetical protein